MIHHPGDFSFNISRVALYVICANVDLIVARVGNTTHGVDEQAHLSNVLSVCVGVLLEGAPYEIRGGDECLLGVIEPDFICEPDSSGGGWNVVGDTELNCMCFLHGGC
ncbi:hypothetical protein CsSME_00009678 [Camellia sinensis var. sinensis]